MNNQDQLKKSGSLGHDNHGVHLCHKCGWPFQKSHPSAKHRRAHKKVCGTIEGYKLIESDALRTQLSVSDYEHASDEDRRTPSPKIEKRSMKEFVSSGGLRTMSNKSEEDMFLDADTEFPDIGFSQGIEERIRESNTKVEKFLTTNLNESHLMKTDATAVHAETSIPLIDPMESSQEALEIAKDQPEIGKPSHGTGSEEIPVGSSGMVASLFHSSHMIFETPTDVSLDEMNAKVDKGTEQEPVNENEDVGIDINLTDSTDPHIEAVRDGSTSEFNFEETDKQASDALIEEKERELEGRKGNSSDSVTLEAVVQEPVTTDGNVEQKKDENDAPETNMVKGGVSPLVKPLDMEDSIADLTQVIGGSGYGKIVEVNDCREEGKDERHDSNAEKEQEGMMVSDSMEQKKEDTVSHLSEAQKDEIQLQSSTNQKESTNCHLREEEKQNKHFLFVPHDSPVIDNVESMIEGFKDHHMLKSTLPLDLGFDEVIMSAHGDDKKDIISRESSSADLNALKQDLNQNDVEKPIEGNDDVSGVISGNGEDCKSCNIEVPTVLMAETQIGFHLHSIESDHLQNAHSEDGVVYKQTSESCEVEDGDNNEMNKTKECVVARNENTKEPLDDELSANVLENADSSSISEDNQTISSLKEDGNRNHERAEVVVLNIARCESAEVVGGGEKMVKNTEATEESSEQSPKSSDLDSVPDKVPNAERNTEHTGSSLLKYDESSQGASQVYETGNITDVLDSVDLTAKPVEGNYDDTLLASNENPIDSTSKEATPLHVESVLLNKSSATIDVNQAVESAPDCNSDPSQVEGEGDKFGNQHEGVTVTDKSVASSSRADSLEGNWGSVSDTTANSDVGSSPFLVSQLPAKLETNLQTPQDATNICHPDQSDVFEPPTVMTLDESGDRVSKKAALEIQTAPITQQQEPEDLQAGPAPSLTNVENESEGRKKNEEIIAKVSTSRNPLKNLLGEANSPNSKQVPPAILSDASVAKSSNTAVTTVNAILSSEEPNDHQATDKETNKEWNSPARYPSEIKKEKRKGKPYWVPFVCCSSVH